MRNKHLALAGPLALLLILPRAAPGQQEVPYGIVSLWEWRISASSTDAEIQVGAPFLGERDLYLWLTCAIEGASVARMDLVGSLELVSFTPESGVTLSAPLPALELDIGCQGGPWFLAGTLRVRDSTGAGGDVCMGPNRRTTRCADDYFEDHASYGFTTLPSGPCWGGAYCAIDYVDPLSWGRVKAYFESGR